MVNGGQLEAGLLEVLLDEAPFAMALLIEGLFNITKLPQIASSVSTHQKFSWCYRWMLDKERKPLTHEGKLEIRPLISCCGAEISRHIRAMSCNRDGILVFITSTISIAECFCHPVTGTNEGRFPVDIVGALLLTRADLALIKGSRASISECCKLGRVGIIGCIAAWIVEQDFGDVVVRE